MTQHIGILGQTQTPFWWTRAKALYPESFQQIKPARGSHWLIAFDAITPYQPRLQKGIVHMAQSRPGVFFRAEENAGVEGDIALVWVYVSTYACGGVFG